MKKTAFKVLCDSIKIAESVNKKIKNRENKKLNVIALFTIELDIEIEKFHKKLEYNFSWRYKIEQSKKHDNIFYLTLIVCKNSIYESQSAKLTFVH